MPYLFVVVDSKPYISYFPAVTGVTCSGSLYLFGMWHHCMFSPPQLDMIPHNNYEEIDVLCQHGHILQLSTAAKHINTCILIKLVVINENLQTDNDDLVLFMCPFVIRNSTKITIKIITLNNLFVALAAMMDIALIQLSLSIWIN